MPGVDELWVFEAGKGINYVKLNFNFSFLREKSNTNESALQAISDSALRKDGSNLTPEIINKFKQTTPVVLSAQGNISLQDDKDYYLTLTGNGKIVLPAVPADQLSHTITLVVAGGTFSLDLGTTNSLLQADINPKQDYQVMFIYNKIDNKWYYSLGQ